VPHRRCLVGVRKNMMTSGRPRSNADRDACPVILVVEDEWIIRMATVDALRAGGKCVVEAADGAEAIEFIQSGAAVDLIFTDVKMPGSIDGLALLAFVQKNIPHVPVVMSSGHLEPAMALNAGAAAFLVKPYRLEEVLALVDASLAHPIDQIV
jgi:CheY-like chemotaxis protein